MVGMTKRATTNPFTKTSSALNGREAPCARHAVKRQ